MSKKTSKTQQILLAAIYLTLGIPLIVTSCQSSEVYDMSSSAKISDKDALCISVKMIKDLASQIKGASDLKSLLTKQLTGSDEHKLAASFNSLRVCSLVIGVILVCFAFLNLISVFVPNKKDKK